MKYYFWKDRDILEFYKKNRESSGTAKSIFFDVGACKGEYSRLLVSLFDDCEIHCFEPVKDLYNCLVENFRDNQNIIAHNMAISSVNNENQCINYLPAHYEWSSLFYRECFKGKEIRKESVHVMSIDQFCHTNNIEIIDFLKIDTEGNELNVVKGSIEMLTAGKINSGQFEYGGAFLDAHTSLAEICEILKEAEYTIYNYDTIIDNVIEETYEYTNFCFMKNKFLSKGG